MTAETNPGLPTAGTYPGRCYFIELNACVTRNRNECKTLYKINKQSIIQFTLILVGL